MKKIVSILMQRDGMNEADARDLVSAVRDDLRVAIESGDYDLVEDIMLYDLGLEMDYVFDLV